eukprot:9254350-Heterocapsa_arctica.AAC.1
MEVEPSAPLAPHSKAFEEVAARLVDLRGVARPPSLTGKDAEWPEFRFRMESIASLLGCDAIMAEAIRAKDEPDMDLLSNDDAALS